jgi:pSer/pThr/pTyr-binding forkhead associated (FHA) protein
MAKLQFKTQGFENHAIELRLGVNRLGRALGNDIQLYDHTVSGTHCEVTVGCGQISVRDCGSTNGTFLDGTLIQDAVLHPGQALRLGDVELLVTDISVPVSIPKFDLPLSPHPVMLSNGSVLCRRHRTSQATYRCQHCNELLCEECIHLLRRRGGKLLHLCPSCSYPVEPIGGEKKKKKSFFCRLRETTKLFFSPRHR